MATLIEMPGAERLDPAAGTLGLAVLRMGQRLSAAYVDGAIPYMQSYEPALWAELEALDGQDSLAALGGYERLFREGIRRYLAALRSAAA